MRITNFVAATAEYRVLVMHCTCADRTVPPTKELDVVSHKVVGWFFDADGGCALPGIMGDAGVKVQTLFKNGDYGDDGVLSISCERAVEVGKAFIGMEHSIMHGLDEHFAREVKRANG